MEAPQGYDVPDGHILLLKKALYSLKQAGRQWYLTVMNWYFSCSFRLIFDNTYKHFLS